jgi:hypothetical protein
LIGPLALQRERRVGGRKETFETPTGGALRPSAGGCQRRTRASAEGA